MPVMIDLKKDIAEVIHPIIEELKKLENKFEDNFTLLRRQDLSKMFNIKIETVDKWVREGELPPHDFRVGKIRYWEKKNLTKFLENKKNKK